VKKEFRNWLVVLFVLCFVATGCASSGAGAGGEGGPAPDATAAAEPMVDRDAVGENGLLTPSAILARYVDAVGGEDALRSHTSVTVKGVFGISAMGMEGDSVVYLQAPDHMVQLIELPGMGTMNVGYNGEIGWSDNPMTGPSLMEGDLLVVTREQANFYAPLEYDSMYPTQETVELTEFNDQSAYKVRVVNASDNEMFHFFSEDSGLLIGIEGEQPGPMGNSEVSIRIGEYADFDGVLQPKSTIIETQGMEISQTVKEVIWDSVPEDAFAVPASIQALVE
jgi:hypothetical protein